MTLAQARSTLRIVHQLLDGDISALMLEAYDQAERRTGRMIRTFSGVLTMSAFPEDGGVIVLPRPPLVGVSSITYFDTANVSQTLAGHQVFAAAMPGYVALPVGLTQWPLTKERNDAVTVTFTGGGVEPESLRAAVRLLLDVSFNDLTPAKQQVVQKRIDDLLFGFTVRDPNLYGITT